MYSVYQHWDPLQVCLVGASYPPEFYSFIKNHRVRAVMERIAQETEEDYQALIRLLESFGVTVLRPQVSNDWQDYYRADINKIDSPPMYPRDYSIMLGGTFFWRTWSDQSVSYQPLPLSTIPDPNDQMWNTALSHIHKNTARFITGPIGCPATIDWSGATIIRVGQDLFFGTSQYNEDSTDKKIWLQSNLSEYRSHIVDTGGHADGVFCAVRPGLLVSTSDVTNYDKTFPGWEVLWINDRISGLKNFLNFKNKNHGRWWVPGQELNDEFTEFVESWLSHWMGYVEETVFDVNMLIIDQSNVVVSSENPKLFKKFQEHGITPHVIPLRHRYFWDGGWHCSTSDISRLGDKQDYFPAV